MVAFALPDLSQLPSTYGVDFETTYVKGVRDIGALGTVGYLRHPETDIYLVSIYGPGVSYSGSVAEAPWHAIDGMHWVSHNAAFDAAVFIELRRRNLIDLSIGPVQWDCTANLAAFNGSGRSLAAAAEALLGEGPVDKSTRDQMNNQRWETMSPEFRQECIIYALKDAELCWRLWDGYGPSWPAPEVAASRHTLDMCLRGIATDAEYLKTSENILKAALWDAENRIPWAGTLDAKGKEIKITSSKALKAECVAIGIPPPVSTADKNEGFDRWLEEYGDAAPFVKAVKDYRSVNRTLGVLKKFSGRTFDGRMPYDLKYAGAHTLRWSGGSGLNVHNLTKKLVAGVDMRGCLIPAAGKKFVVADLKQIEARVALWYAEDWAQLDLLRGGMDVYEAHARRFMGYDLPMELSEYVKQDGLTEAQHNLRQIAKARVLGLGFGMGHVRLIDFAKTQLGLILSVRDAKRIVDSYRADNRGIVRMWRRLQSAMESHAARKDRGPFIIELPSWRSLEYYDVNTAEGLKARDEIGGRMTHWFGGKLFENLVQATARDVLLEAILRIEANYPESVVLHVHDEVICEVDMDVPASAIGALMSVTPDWAEGLPVDSSFDDAERYFKD